MWQLRQTLVIPLKLRFRINEFNATGLAVGDGMAIGVHQLEGAGDTTSGRKQ